MKKILAVFLAVVMAFSAGVAAFAYGTLGDVPANPEPIEGKVNFVAESTFIEAGQTYEIPVSVVSDYTTTVESGKLVMSFQASMAGDPSVTMTGIRFSDEVKALPGFKEGACGYSTSLLAAFCSFSVDDLSLLKQTNFVIAYVTVEVADTYEGGAKEASVDLSGYDISFLFDGIFDDLTVANELFEYASPVGAESFVSIVDNDGNVTALEVTGATDADVYFTAGHMWEEPERPSATDLLVVQLKRLGLQIVVFLQAILEIVAGLLQPTV